MAVRLLARHLISTPHLFACAVCTPAQLQAQIKVLRSALESGASGGNGSGPLPGDVASATADADNAAHEAAAAKERLALVARQLLAVVRTTSLKPGGGASIAKLLKVVVDNVVSGDGAGVTLKELSVRCLLGAAAVACTCSQGLALAWGWMPLGVVNRHTSLAGSSYKIAWPTLWPWACWTWLQKARLLCGLQRREGWQ